MVPSSRAGLESMPDTSALCRHAWRTCWLYARQLYDVHHLDEQGLTIECDKICLEESGWLLPRMSCAPWGPHFVWTGRVVIWT